MSIQLHEEKGGKILVIQVSGKLVTEDYHFFESEFERLVREHGKLRVLFDITGFHGWEGGEIKLSMKHFSYIERLATVGEKKWQQGMVKSYQHFTKAPIQYFDQANLVEAREWLCES